MKTEFNAAEKADSIGTKVAKRLEALNLRLVEIALKLREIQPKRDGVLLMELYDCHAGCLGCGHIRWVQWRWHDRNTSKKWVGHVIKDDPARRLLRRGDFADTWEERVALVREVKDIQKKRSLLVKHLSALNQAILNAERQEALIIPSHDEVENPDLPTD